MIARSTTFAALAAAAFLCAAATAGAATQTTAPGAIAHVPITLTTTKILIPKDQFITKAHPEIARYPRGAQIDFRIRNRGKKPVVFVLRLKSNLHFYGSSRLKKVVRLPKPVRPGTMQHMRISFYFRADFAFEMLRNGKVVARHPLQIF